MIDAANDRALATAGDAYEDYMAALAEYHEALSALYEARSRLPSAEMTVCYCGAGDALRTGPHHDPACDSYCAFYPEES